MKKISKIHIIKSLGYIQNVFGTKSNFSRGKILLFKNRPIMHYSRQTKSKVDV